MNERYPQLERALALLALCLLGPPARASEASRSFRAMGTTLELRIEAKSRQLALDAADLAYQAVREDELRLSTWIPESELSKLNASPSGAPVPLSPRLESDLRKAGQCAERTGYVFTPWIGPLVDAWGLRNGGRVPTDEELQVALRASRPGAFVLTSGAMTKRDPMARVEEGGFGKGLALDDALSALHSTGVSRGTLNFGGQIAILGQRTETVDIADPRDRAKPLIRFRARFPGGRGSISTSGNSEHGIVFGPGERKIGHLIDPRSGSPAPFDGSLTVIARTGMEADCLSKIFVLGADAGLEWANRNRIQALYLSPDPSRAGRWIARESCPWEPRLHPLSRNVQIRRDCKTSTREE